MFDVGLSQLSTDDLMAELRKRHSSMIFAGLSPDGGESTLVMGGNKLMCCGLAACLQRATVDSEAE